MTVELNRHCVQGQFASRLTLIESGYYSKLTFFCTYCKVVNSVIYILVLFGNDDNLLVEKN